MLHFYEFFDAERFDAIWTLSWSEFQRKYRSRWATKKSYDDSGYFDNSLRELICFCVEPQPDAEALESILAQRTVQWTIRHSTPQFYFMYELMSHIPGSSESVGYAIDITDDDVSVLISAALGGYIAGKLADAALLAVLKLHSCSDPEEWVVLSRAERAQVAALIAGMDMLKPVYVWQGRGACRDDEGQTPRSRLRNAALHLVRHAGVPRNGHSRD